MFCPKCGMKGNDGANFCTNCGTALREQPDEGTGQLFHAHHEQKDPINRQQQTPQDGQPADQLRPKKIKTWMKIVIGIVIVIVLAVAAAFYFTADLTNTADGFFQSIKKQDMAAAHSYLSEDFKASTNETALKEFLSRSTLSRFKKASWSERTVSGGRGELSGEVVTDTGGVVPIKLHFIKENNVWKIYSIKQTTAGLQTQTTSAAIPAQAYQAALVKRSMHDFGISVNNRSMNHFYGTISKMWRQQFTIEKINDAFSKVYNAGVDFTVLDRFEPVIEPVSNLGQHGELVVSGYFPTQPKRVYFKQTYVYEGTDWKLLGFTFNIK